MSDFESPADFKKLDHLFTRARHEEPPPLNVTDAVMQRIADLQSERRQEVVWWVSSAVALVAACTMLAMVYPMWEAWNDPLMAWFEPMRMALR